MSDYKPGCCIDKSCNSKTCMRLPQKETCGRCSRFDLCQKFVGVNKDNRVCDWFPRRFVRVEMV